MGFPLTETHYVPVILAEANAVAKVDLYSTICR